MDAEEWRALGSGWKYEVSNLGRVRRTGKDRVLKAFLWGGRMRVSLSHLGEVTQECVASLVLSAFKGAPPIGDYAPTHADANIANCRLENLSWARRLRGRRRAWEQVDAMLERARKK